ncbi:MAG: hypothetical protein AABX12_04570 [Nanoarchaeota archaeon]
MVITLRPIDPHVHLRGEEYPINYLASGIEQAVQMSFAAILEQPNPRPNLIDVDTIRRRRLAAQEYTQERIVHGCHIGLTTNLAQVESAFKAAAAHWQEIRAVKAFWVHSTGNMGLLDPDYQKAVWRKAREVSFKGPFIQHCEDERQFTGTFDYKRPITHSQRQNEHAETIQVEEQIRNAQDVGFEGIFYIAHVSSPDTIDYLETLKGKLPFKIIREVTWHHLFRNTRHYKQQGNRLKMNPPVRDPPVQAKHLEYALQGKFDIIGSDHAPHPLNLKDGQEPPSGIPALPFYPKGIEKLIMLGMPMGMRDSLLFHTANSVFDLRLQPKRISIEYDPSMWNIYGYNPFEDA